MEEVATRLVRYLRDRFCDPETGESAIVLARCFVNLPFRDLEEASLREIARSTSRSKAPSDDLRCLTLLATAGREPDWNDRQLSRRHKVFPLSSEEFVLKLPMISQLISQLGLDIDSVLAPNPTVLIDPEQAAFNVFHVERALGSPYVPVQEQFVVPYGVESVLGFGGMMPSGNLFAIVLFSTIAIPSKTAKRFKSLALNVKFALVPFDDGNIFLK